LIAIKGGIIICKYKVWRSHVRVGKIFLETDKFDVHRVNDELDDCLQHRNYFGEQRK
jgi:hypothetical protein